jgi:hypothetical protein
MFELFALLKKKITFSKLLIWLRIHDFALLNSREAK